MTRAAMLAEQAEAGVREATDRILRKLEFALGLCDECSDPRHRCAECKRQAPPPLALLPPPPPPPDPED